ncbi:MAG: hypothetical protein GXP45_01530 [bacterium]|nr:hypothetical protein [bacterium]
MQQNEIPVEEEIKDKNQEPEVLSVAFLNEDKLLWYKESLNLDDSKDIISL